MLRTPLPDPGVEHVFAASGTEHHGRRPVARTVSLLLPTNTDGSGFLHFYDSVHFSVREEAARGVGVGPIRILDVLYPWDAGRGRIRRR